MLVHNFEGVETTITNWYTFFIRSRKGSEVIWNMVFVCLGVLWGFFNTMRYIDATPIDYSREQLFDIRNNLPSTLILPIYILKQLRHHDLHSIPATIRGTRAGQFIQRPLNVYFSSRSNITFSYALATWFNNFFVTQLSV